MKHQSMFAQSFPVFLVGFSLVVMPACASKSAGAKSSKGNPDTEYKASCQELPANDLTKGAETLKGKKVKCTGKVLVMDFPKETNTGKTPTGFILSVTDEAHALASGQLPVYVTFNGSTDVFIYDTVTVWGEVLGTYSYKSPMIKEKTLPWVEAKYLEKAH